jgi:uncharacterized membrane protein
MYIQNVETVMASLILLARVIHVVAGILWAGVIFVLINAVLPVGRQYATEGAERWTALIAGRVGPISGIAAVFTVLSGGYLMAVLHSNDGTWGGTVLKIGAAAAVVAFLIGVTIARPAGLKLAALAAQSADTEAHQQLTQLRRRVALSGRVVAALVAVAVLAMALFRYVDVLR